MRDVGGIAIQKAVVMPKLRWMAIVLTHPIRRKTWRRECMKWMAKTCIGMVMNGMRNPQTVRGIETEPFMCVGRIWMADGGRSRKEGDKSQNQLNIFYLSFEYQ